MTSAVAETARCLLHVRYPSGGTEAVALDGQPVTMGRSDGNSLVLDDTMSSRFHARIEVVAGEGYVLMDRGSKNGTLLHGEPVTRHVLAEGDVFLIGDTEFRFEVRQPEPITPPQHEAGTVAALLEFAEFLSREEDRLGLLETCTTRLSRVVACESAALLLIEEETRAPLARFGKASDVLLAEAAGIESVRAQRNPASLVVPLRGAVLILERADEFSAEEVRFARLAGAQLATFLRFVT